MSIKVFISHQMADSDLAKRLAARLHSQHQIDSYLDVIDPDIGKNGEDLADHVKTQLGNCTELLAVVSEFTRRSWWVPWEIGVATEKNYPLATFGGTAELPDFLQKWPVLKSMLDLDEYAKAAKSAKRLLTEQKQQSVTASVAQRNSTKEFYRILRAGLRR